MSYTQSQIESSFEEMKASLNKKSHKYTGEQNVLQYMLDHKEVIWFWSWNFVGKTNSRGEWLSHKGPARASDLAIHHPDLVEDRKIGRFSVYRLRTENMDLINKFLNN